jgi:hypothetical protein
MDAPRDDLIRMASHIELRADNGDGRTLFGYASVFNSPTIINSWEGKFTEIVAPGAWKRTLRNNGDKVKILFNHGFDPSIGDKPLGRADVLKEDKTGLYVEVPMSRTTYNDDLIELLNDKALDGMSVRFTVLDERWTEPEPNSKKLPVRTILEAKLYELGPVTFPAFEATSAGVRSRTDFDTWRALDEPRREQIRNIISGTSTPAPGQATAETEPADSDTTRTDSEPHGATTPGITANEQLHAALILRGITHEATDGDPGTPGRDQGQAA